VGGSRLWRFALSEGRHLFILSQEAHIMYFHLPCFFFLQKTKPLTMSSGDEQEDDLGEVGGWRPVTTEAVTDYAGEQVEIIIRLSQLTLKFDEKV
jgi:hypothetical protein